VKEAVEVHHGSVNTCVTKSRPLLLEHIAVLLKNPFCVCVTVVSEEVCKFFRAQPWGGIAGSGLEKVISHDWLPTLDKAQLVLPLR
jgi:hypothetical protein